MKILKELGKAFFIGSLIFVILGAVQLFSGTFYQNGKQILVAFIYNQVYSVALYMANVFLFMHLLKKYKGELFKFKVLVFAICAGIMISFVVISLVEMFLQTTFVGLTFAEFWEQLTPGDYYISMTISMVVNTIFYVVFYYRYRQETTVKEQKIIAGAASAQFDALKNQLDPHFLFNSLNVLTSLIEENPEAATRFTTALSKVYRYVLEQKNKQLVTVEEELKFAKLYMSLIKMRFEDSIVYTPPTQISNPDAKVVPLSLQLLLENAVKHNKVTPDKKLYITIYEENGNLVIKNNVQPKNVMRESTGVGLQNIRKRYYLLTDRKVAIEQNQKEFKVAVPLLTKNISSGIPKQEAYISSKKYDRAKKKVEELKGFYIHFSIYLIMIPVFIYLNVKSTGFPWALFPILGWGAGVAGHAMETFNYNPFLGKNWEERKVRELMDKDNK